MEKLPIQKDSELSDREDDKEGSRTKTHFEPRVSVILHAFGGQNSMTFQPPSSTSIICIYTTLPKVTYIHLVNMSEVKSIHPEVMYAERSSADEPEKVSYSSIYGSLSTFSCFFTLYPFWKRLTWSEAQLLRAPVAR